MFTRKDLLALVSRKIFDRGQAYYDSDLVGRLHRNGNTFTAKVQGTETYHVKLTIRPRQLPTISCDCPYDYGNVCKHGIALGLAVLHSSPAERTAAPLATAPAKLSDQERRARLLTAAWARTTDRERLAYLRQFLKQKPKQLARFLAAFEFNENLLLKAEVRERSSLPPPPARRLPPPRRPPTLLEQARELVKKKKGPELLPHLLTMDWLREPQPFNLQVWPYLLAEAAGAQPEATFDAVMERFEDYLDQKELRGGQLYNYLSACLRALAQVPALTPQVQLFASELLRQYSRLSALRHSLSAGGFSIIVNELDTGLPLKKRGRPARKKE